MKYHLTITDDNDTCIAFAAQPLTADEMTLIMSKLILARGNTFEVTQVLKGDRAYSEGVEIDPLEERRAKGAVSCTAR